jgi:excisionase family DNA binding protein
MRATPRSILKRSDARKDNKVAQADPWRLINSSYHTVLEGNWTPPLAPEQELVQEVFMLIDKKLPPSRFRSTFEPLLDLHEAASVLGMHWKTLEGKARQHEVPAFKVGKRWRFRLSSLNNWLETGLKSNTPDQAVVTEQEQHP